MEYSKIVSVPGLPGLYTVTSQKSNGIIVQGLEDGKAQFVSLRTGGFAVLDNISMYTTTDTVPLHDIFNKMHEIEAKNPPIDSNKSNDELRAYMENVLPDFDKQRVKISDIKKLLKWYTILKQHNVIPIPNAKAEETADVKAEPKVEVKEESKPEAVAAVKPKAKSKAKAKTDTGAKAE